MFESSQLLSLALARAGQDQHTEAEALLVDAVRLSQQTTPEFVGAWALGALALVTRDGAQRAAALNQGEALLRQGSLAHSHLHFYQLAIEAELASRDWDGAQRYAQLLADYAVQEPLPWCDFFSARGRLLADHGRGRRDAETRASLRRLRDQAELCGLRIALGALDAALTED